MGTEFGDRDGDGNDDGFDNRRHRTQHAEYERPRWRIYDTVVKGENAAIEVSILELEVPRFSFRVGTAHFPQYEGDPIKVSPRLTIFNVADAAELLTELAVKYSKLREDKIEELEDRKDRALSRLRGEPEVIVRKTKI
jgi:hypothetical protein